MSVTPEKNITAAHFEAAVRFFGRAIMFYEPSPRLGFRSSECFARTSLIHILRADLGDRSLSMHLDYFRFCEDVMQATTFAGQDHGKVENVEKAPNDGDRTNQAKAPFAEDDTVEETDRASVQLDDFDAKSSFADCLTSVHDLVPLIRTQYENT
jgi:hypothetical protein